MQAGDNYGICYTFPFMLFYELCYNGETSGFLKNRTFDHFQRFPCYEKLIKRKEFHTIISIMLSKIYKDIKYEFLEFYRRPDYSTVHTHSLLTKKQIIFNKKIENMFESKGTIYMKLLLSEIVSYLMQPAMKNRVEAIMKN